MIQEFVTPTEQKTQAMPSDLSEGDGMTQQKAKRFAFFRAMKPKIVSLLNRKYIVLACSVVLLGGAIYLNWLFFADNTPTATDDGSQDAGSGTVIDYTAQGGAQEEESYFAVAQINRQRARDEAIDVYRTVADSTDALREIRDEALNGINRIAAQIEKEANIEAMIKSKGFSECVAVLGDSTASVIVQSDALLPNEIAQIKEIVVEQSGIPVSGIKIIEVKA